MYTYNYIYIHIYTSVGGPCSKHSPPKKNCEYKMYQILHKNVQCEEVTLVWDIQVSTIFATRTEGTLHERAGPNEGLKEYSECVTATCQFSGIPQSAVCTSFQSC